MTEFVLGKIKFTWKGNWAVSTVYEKDDIVKYGGNTYVCITGHTSGSAIPDFYTDIAKWNVHVEGVTHKGDHADATYYKINDIVKSDQHQYICTTQHTSTATINLTNFTLYVQGGLVAAQAGKSGQFLSTDGTNTTWVDIVEAAPGALDTLNELAASLADDADFAGTMTTALAGKEPTLTAGTTAQYYRGDKTWQTLTVDPTMGGDMSGTASNAQIAAGAVDTAEIAAGAVTSNEIAAGAVGSSEIAADAVGSSEIATGAVGATEIASTLDLSSKTVTLAAGEVSASELDATLDLSGKTVTLPAASVTAHVTQFDDNQLKEEIALLGFRTAANGSLAKYNLVDQTIDAFEDASGIDTSGSTDISRSTSNYYHGGSGNDDITAFTSSGTFTTDSETTSVEVLVVAGGGSTVSGGAGGGGAGGVVHHAGYTVIASTAYGVTVGGAAANSVFDTAGVGAGPMTANAGGSAGNRFASGGAGGSGSGGGYDENNAGGASNQSDSGGGTGYGYAGGAGIASSPYPSGGGGGAGGPGISSTGDSSDLDGPMGGLGKYFASFVAYGTDSNNVASTGANGGWFASGGGGSKHGNYCTYAAQSGGGGGGGGGQAGPSTGATGVGVSGLANTGGGAGGGWAGSATGGSGVVLVKNIKTIADMTLISNATTAEAVPTKGDLVMTYSNGAGTATVNTDLKAYASRDDGTTWTQLTLASQGSTGGHTILSAHDLDISSQPSGTDMRYKITTHNQSVTKETRVHAVSLGWS